MIIQNLKLKNFKTFGREVNVPMRRITLIYGQNSSGKSSLIQSLILLKQSLEGEQQQKGLITSSETGLFDFGSFRNIIHKQNPNNKVEIELEVRKQAPVNAQIARSAGRRFRHLDNVITAYRLTYEDEFSTSNNYEEIPIADLMKSQSVLEKIDYIFKDAGDMSTDPITATLLFDKEYSDKFDMEEFSTEANQEIAQRQTKQKFYQWQDEEAFANFIKLERFCDPRWDAYSKEFDDGSQNEKDQIRVEPEKLDLIKVSSELVEDELKEFLNQAIKKNSQTAFISGKYLDTKKIIRVLGDSDKVVWHSAPNPLNKSTLDVRVILAVGSWTAGVPALEKYVLEEGDADVTQGTIVNQFRLYDWIIGIKQVNARCRNEDIEDDPIIEEFCTLQPGWDWSLPQNVVPGKNFHMGNFETIDSISNQDHVSKYVEDISGTYLPVRAEAVASLIPDTLDASAQKNQNLEGLPNWSPQLLRSLSYRFKTTFAQMKYLGPLRIRLSRRNPVSGQETVLNDVGASGEHTPEVMFRAPELIQRETNRWFKRFDIPYELKIRNDRVHPAVGGTVILYLADTRHTKSVNVSTLDVGTGIGQLLPIIVQGVMSSRTEPNIICVEQPELHLHPKMQAEIADLFIGTSGSEEYEGQMQGHNQWIVETHSELLVHRLLKRVRQGEIDPEDISVLYVQRDANGESDVSRLRISPDGGFLDSWPQGFFEEGFNEMFNDGGTDINLAEQEKLNKELQSYLEDSEYSQDET